MEEKGKNLELAEARDAIELVPTWEPQLWWFFAGALLVYNVLIVVFIIHYFRKKSKIDHMKHKRAAYEEAKAAFGLGGSQDTRENAIQVSMILRRYLAKSRNEPALFETHEEFVARHDGLKDLPENLRSEVGSFFSKLAAIKYTPDDMACLDAQSILTDGAAILEGIHRA